MKGEEEPCRGQDLDPEVLKTDPRHHFGQGIGRELFETILNKSTGEKITVNASPYSVEVYKKLGFVPESDEQIADGMRFTPMTYTK